MKRKPSAIVGWILASSCLLAPAAWAMEYRIQVTNLDYLTFVAHTERAPAASCGEERMGQLEAQLDKMEFPPGAVLPGRQVRLLEDPGYGGKPPARLSLLPATGEQAWTTVVWEANPGDTVAFMVRSEIKAWPQVWAVAANPEGVLRRLSMGGVSFFSRQQPEVPEVSDDYIANAVRQGTFTRWLERNAKALHGMSVVVGRGLNTSTLSDNVSDRVYAVIKLPPEPYTFKLVIGWRTEWRKPGGN
jgi:hypothetical protein